LSARRLSRALFPARPPDGCATAYRNLFAGSHSRAAAARELCEQLWGDFWDLADANFIERFPFEFHQRWFEMYLGAALRRAGLNVGAPKPGPDLQVVVDDRRIHIEAIAPTAGHPQHADAVREPVYRDAEGNLIAVQVPHDRITLRLASAFRAKADVFDRYRRDGHVAPDEACVIAINLREIPHAWADAGESWFRTLYGVGNRFVGIDPAGGPTVEGRDHRMLLQRAGGAQEDVAPLLRDEQAAISAVLGSSADVGNVPNLLGGDFVLMPHATARSPYPSAFIRRGVEVHLHPDGGARWTVENIDHGAHRPRGPELVVVDLDGTKIEGEWSVKGRTLSVRVGKHSCDVLLAGGDDPAATAQRIAVEMIRTYRD
jgi:hypothetical protein